MSLVLAAVVPAAWLFAEGGLLSIEAQVVRTRGIEASSVILDASPRSTM